MPSIMLIQNPGFTSVNVVIEGSTNATLSVGGWVSEGHMIIHMINSPYGSCDIFLIIHYNELIVVGVAIELSNNSTFIPRMKNDHIEQRVK